MHLDRRGRPGGRIRIGSALCSRQFANPSENTRVTMPVKMMPSERRTAIQLRRPPTIAALAVPTATPAAMGSDVSSVRMAAP